MDNRPPELHGLLELVLEVGNLEQSLEFYRDYLGLAEVQRWPEPRPAVWLDMGENEVLGLWPERTGGSGVGLHGSRGGAHIHFALHADPGSLERWIEILQSHGLTVHGPKSFGSDKQSIFVRDPDGNLVELAEWRTDASGRDVTKFRRSPTP